MRSDADFLADIVVRAERVATIVARGEAAYIADLDAQDALVRNLEVIGEAVKRLSPELREAHGNIPWVLAAGLRDKLIHGYFGIDLSLVWDTATKNLPPFVEQVLALQTKE